MWLLASCRLATWPGDSCSPELQCWDSDCSTLGTVSQCVIRCGTTYAQSRENI